MAHRLIRSLRRRTTPNVSSYFHSKTLIQQPPPRSFHHFIQEKQSFTHKLNPLDEQRRNYISEMRKSAFEGNILRLLRNEIQYELERSPPTQQPVQEFVSFKVDEWPGEQWIRLSRKFGENEEIKIEVTMFDHSIPVGDVAKGEDVQLHITMIVDVFKGDGSDVLEFVCSAWPDSVEIQKVFTRRHEWMTGHPYLGPGFKELDDKLQYMLYEFLETRGITDDLATFLHGYMKNKDKIEFTQWMGNVKSFIEKK
ncbi:hypothetical protein LguiB_008168 [Lonicera macranthoides]